MSRPETLKPQGAVMSERQKIVLRKRTAPSTSLRGSRSLSRLSFRISTTLLRAAVDDRLGTPVNACRTKWTRCLLVWTLSHGLRGRGQAWSRPRRMNMSKTTELVNGFKGALGRGDFAAARKFLA